MMNQNGTVKNLMNISNVSSTLTFTDPSDDFTSHMRCISSSGIVKDIHITKGNKCVSINLLYKRNVWYRSNVMSHSLMCIVCL